ncbi:MAG: MBL fold metallo-hydrolase [Ruthenibacterium sp.]
MKLTFLGAAHEVTGSMTLLETSGKCILIDCGMEQGSDVFVNEKLPIKPSDVDFVLLTHAHMDHAGMLPWLVKNGFSGAIYTTEASADLCNIMLQDSAHIQESDAEWKNRKAQRAGREPVEALYTMEDAMAALRLLKPLPYQKRSTLCAGVEVCFVDAGHLLGSASIEIWLSENGVSKKLVCSGDIGNQNQPIIRDPQYLTTADYVMMESTYGDRSHGPVPDYVTELAEILQRTFDRGGSVIVPAFAVGRTQELLYFLRLILEQKRVKGHDGFPVYVDSPLANEATHVFNENVQDCCDDDTRALLQKGINPLSFPNLRCSVTTDDSKAINFDETPKVILSASGMCDAGRIRHHLKHHLWRPECTVLFVGYQSAGTLGRMLLDGVKTVRLFGETVDVQASICSLNGISGHADNEGLMQWAASFGQTPQRVFVNHGDEASCETLTARLANELHYTAVAPYSGDAWDLAQNCQVAKGERARIVKPTAGSPAQQPAYTALVAAAQRLKALAEKCAGRANRDLTKFAAAINALCDAWQ